MRPQHKHTSNCKSTTAAPDKPPGPSHPTKPQARRQDAGTSCYPAGAPAAGSPCSRPPRRRWHTNKLTKEWSHRSARCGRWEGAAARRRPPVKACAPQRRAAAPSAPSSDAKRGGGSTAIPSDSLDCARNAILGDPAARTFGAAALCLPPDFRGQPAASPLTFLQVPPSTPQRPAGSVSRGWGVHACTPCGVGSFAPLPGSFACLRCPPGFGAAVCSFADGGMVKLLQVR